MSRVEKGTGDTAKINANRKLGAEQRGGMALSLQQHEPSAIKLAPVAFLDKRLPGEPVDLKERWR